MEHFIETVRKYPCLWNTTAIEYRDQELKDAAWAEIMKETDLSSVKEVKLKWKKLRDSYRDALKRQSEMLAKEPSNSAKKTYPWKYMGLMQFLQPYMNNRKKPASTAGYGAAPAPAENGHHAAEHSSSESESEPESAVGKRKGSGGGGAGGGPGGAGALAALERKLEYLCKAQASAAKRACPDRTDVYKREAAALPDPLDIFFNSMCQSTKRFPFTTQIKIKKTLFNAVIEAEEALLAEQASYASLWAQGAGSSSSSEPSDDERKPS